MKEELKAGQIVGVPCQIKPGPFSDEYLVTVEIENRLLSGFAREGDVNCEKEVIFGTVLEVGEEKVKVRLHGSFFTTTSGTAFSSPGWANTHFKAVQVVQA